MSKTLSVSFFNHEEFIGIQCPDKQTMISPELDLIPKLIALPGIGKSTAGAIMSLAYQEPYPILDANVKRVISRFKNIENDEKKLWKLSEMLTPKNNIFAYTQGIMDLI